MKEKMLIVLSFWIDPNTWTIVVFANLLYLLNFSFKMGRELILIHDLVTRYNFECLAIAPSTLWDIMSLKQKDCTSSICESKRRGIIIPSIVLRTTQNVDLITFICKRNYLFTITWFSTRFQQPLWLLALKTRN
jgi:hypothetical protein